MKITFLGSGTSQGVPIIACNCYVCKSNNKLDKRLRSSILVEHNNKILVVDTGPDFRQQMLVHDVKTLDAILFTHSHRDHLSGLDDIRGFNFAMKKAIDVYCEPIVEQAIRKEFFYAFQEPKYPGVPEMNLLDLNLKPINLIDLEIIPIRVYHHKLPVLGFRFNDFVYITDANLIPEEEWHKLQGCHTLVLNALRHEEHVSHFTLNQAIEIVKKVNPQKAYFTHISHQLGRHNEVEKNLPPNMHLAYDGLVLEFN